MDKGLRRSLAEPSWGEPIHFVHCRMIHHIATNSNDTAMALKHGNMNALNVPIVGAHHHGASGLGQRVQQHEAVPGQVRLRGEAAAGEGAAGLRGGGRKGLGDRRRGREGCRGGAAAVLGGRGRARRGLVAVDDGEGDGQLVHFSVRLVGLRYEAVQRVQGDAVRGGDEDGEHVPGVEPARRRDALEGFERGHVLVQKAGLGREAGENAGVPYATAAD